MRSLTISTIAVMLVTTLAACTTTPSVEAPAYAEVAATDGDFVLVVGVTPTTASRDESITAMISYRNASSDTTLVAEVGGNPGFRLTATSAAGDVLFDSEALPPGANYTRHLFPNPIILPPGGTVSFERSFRLESPGEYRVQVTMPLLTPKTKPGSGLTSPPIAVTVSRPHA